MNKISGCVISHVSAVQELNKYLIKSSDVIKETEY